MESISDDNNIGYVIYLYCLIKSNGKQFHFHCGNIDSIILL